MLHNNREWISTQGKGEIAVLPKNFFQKIVFFKNKSFSSISIFILFLLLSMSSRQTQLVIKRDLIFHVFSGGSGASVIQFSTALSRFKANVLGARDHIKVVYITNIDVRENIDNRFETPEKFFIWLTSGDLYFITSQGIWLGLITSGTNQFGWNVTRLSINFAILANATSVVGFPSRNKLLDCVWNGDKAEYIRELDDLAIPTLCIKLCEINNFAELKAAGLTVST